MKLKVSYFSAGKLYAGFFVNGKYFQRVVKYSRKGNPYVVFRKEKCPVIGEFYSHDNENNI